MQNGFNSYDVMDGIRYKDRQNHITDYVYKQYIAWICSECFNKLGEMELSCNYSINCHSQDIPLDKCNDLIPKSPIHDTGYTTCPICGKKTEHFFIDYNIADIIIKLNKNGFKTLYSCEAHNMLNCSIDLPYILFADNYSNYFDMNNKLLKYFSMEIDEYQRDNEIIQVCCLRVNPDECSFKYMMNNMWVDDLTEYIDKYLIKDKGDKR